MVFGAKSLRERAIGDRHDRRDRDDRDDDRQSRLERFNDAIERIDLRIGQMSDDRS
jgi:hypothetical protein